MIHFFIYEVNFFKNTQFDSWKFMNWVNDCTVLEILELNTPDGPNFIPDTHVDNSQRGYLDS